MQKIKKPSNHLFYILGQVDLQQMIHNREFWLSRAYIDSAIINPSRGDFELWERQLPQLREALVIRQSIDNGTHSFE